jgi:hypothetical protein
VYARLTITKAPEDRIEDLTRQVEDGFSERVGQIEGLTGSLVLLHRATVTMYGIGLFETLHEAQRIDDAVIHDMRSGLRRAAGTSLDDVRLCEVLARSG